MVFRVQGGEVYSPFYMCTVAFVSKVTYGIKYTERDDHLKHLNLPLPLVFWITHKLKSWKHCKVSKSKGTLDRAHNQVLWVVVYLLSTMLSGHVSTDSAGPVHSIGQS